MLKYNGILRTFIINVSHDGLKPPFTFPILFIIMAYSFSKGNITKKNREHVKKLQTKTMLKAEEKTAFLLEVCVLKIYLFVHSFLTTFLTMIRFTLDRES